jgi:predicted O-methyltransferase YrrM
MNREQLLEKLRWYWWENKVPNISVTNAKFLRDLIKIQKTKNMFEIWTANGFSAINFWIELERTGWKLTTIDFSSKSYEEAKKNIWEAKFENTITQILWNAIDEIPKFKDNFFDFVFIDWMKKRSKDFLELSLPKVKKWWIIIIDDVLKFHDKMANLWEYLRDNDIEYNVLPIDFDDGVLMIVKQS